MKQFFIIFILMLTIVASVSSFCYAQELYPVGKSWIQVSAGDSPNEFVNRRERFTIIGDTLVEGLTCRKAIVVRINNDGSISPKSDIAIFYENNNIAYEYNPSPGLSEEQEELLGSKFVPLTDFNLNEGDLVTITSPSLPMKVHKVDSITVSGEKRKRMFVGGTTMTDLSRCAVWIEGVGSNYDTYGGYMEVSGNYYNISFSMDGVEYFTYDDFYAGIISALETVVAPIETDDAIYNIKGQIIATPRKGEIVIKNGKKQLIN